MSPAPTSTDLVVATTKELAESFHGTELQPLWNKAVLYASGGMVQNALRGKPADVMAIMINCAELALPPTPMNIKRFWIGPDGTPEPNAELTIGLAADAGYETHWGRNDDELAELSIRRYGDAEWQTFTFTIEQAKRAHLLDEWAEHWAETQGGKSYKQTFVTRCQSPEPCKASLGPVPEWVEKDKRTVHKRHDNWFNWPADMLCARVAVRAVKRAAPEVRLGLVGHVRAVPTTRGHVPHVVLTQPAADPDDEITDAEIVYGPGEEPFEEASAAEVTTEDAGGSTSPSAVRPEQPSGPAAAEETATATKTETGTVSAAKAKIELARAAEDAGVSETQARALVTQVWMEYRLGKEPVSRAALEVMLADIRQKASAATATTAVVPSTSGPVAAEGSETLFGGGER